MKLLSRHSSIAPPNALTGGRHVDPMGHWIADTPKTSGRPDNELGDTDLEFMEDYQFEGPREPRFGVRWGVIITVVSEGPSANGSHRGIKDRIVRSLE